ncbi:MAG TPA: hypothetical protein VMT18_15845 [Planctomycetota bacterium]|nr:hypothetical protein [Planctomycetota bacterium]
MPHRLHLLALLALWGEVAHVTAHVGEPSKVVLRTRLEVAGRALDGPTRAKLVLARGSTVLWSNDGSGDYERAPQGSVPIEVREGELTLTLGEPPMPALPAQVLERPASIALHLWVEVEGHFLKVPGVLQLGGDASARSPDGELALTRDPRIVQAALERGAEDKTEKRAQKATGMAEAMAYRRARRLDDRGQIPADALVKAKRQLDAMPVLKPGNGLSEDAGLMSWAWMGPGNIGGRIRTILTHPTQPATLWIGSVGGGIWKSTDGGSSWSPADDFMTSLAVTSLVMKPGDPTVLYAATGEGFGNIDALPGAGIFKSTDGGATWSQLSATAPSSASSPWRFVTRLAVVPSAPERIFATLGDGTVVLSTNEGVNWPPVLLTGEVALDVKVHPTQNNWVAVGTNQSVWTSSAFGAVGSWTKQSTGAANKLPNDSGRCEIAFGIAATMTIFASLNRNQGEIWASTDGAAGVWSLRNTGTGYLDGLGNYANTIWVSPTDPQLVVVGGLNLHRSTNGGASLSQISDWKQYHTGKSAHADHHTIVHAAGFDGTTNKTVFFGNDGGIQKTTDITKVDDTDNWLNLANGLGVTQFYGGAVAPDGSVLIGGTQDNDTLRFTPAGGVEGWYQAETGDGGVCAVDWADPSRLYGEYIRLRIERSTDGGNSYSVKTDGLTDADDPCTAFFIAPFEMNPNTPTTLIAGGESIWRTTNAADSWNAIRGPITDPFWTGMKPAAWSCTNPSAPRCGALAIAHGDSSVIWAGYESGRVSRTLNGGASWQNVDVSLPHNRNVTDIAIHPYDVNQVFVTYGGYQTQSIWYTDDGGATWADRTGTAPYDLPPIQLNTVTFHPADPTWVYVGTDLGVLASEDLGLTWSVLPAIPGVGHEGPVNTEVAHLFWQGGSSLIAATHGRGMYRATPFLALYVDKAYVGVEQGTFEQPFRSIDAARAVALPGTVIVAKAATYSEAPIVFDVSGELRAVGGSVVVE